MKTQCSQKLIKINNPSSTLSKLEKKKTKYEVNRRKIRIRAEINETENRKSIEKINKAKVVLGKDQKIDNLLARLTKKEKEKTQITK